MGSVGRQGMGRSSRQLKCVCVHISIPISTTKARAGVRETKQQPTTAAQLQASIHVQTRFHKAALMPLTSRAGGWCPPMPF